MRSGMAAAVTFLLMTCCYQMTAVSAKCENLEFQFFTDNDCSEQSSVSQTDTDFKTFIEEILEDPEIENPNLSMCFEKSDPNQTNQKDYFKVSCLIL